MRYVWKKDGTPAYGVIAQDVIKTMPEAVQGGPSTTMVVDYDQLIAPLIEAVKTLKADNDNLRLELKAANDNDRNEIEALRKELRDLKAGVGWKRAVGQ